MELGNRILSDVVTFMKYAKYIKEKTRREEWSEVVTRNKNMHLKKFPKFKEEIEEAYQLVYEKKILPSMRSLQFGGKPIEVNPSRLYNCCALPMNHIDAFAEVMFLLLAGVGVGYSVQRHHVNQLPEIKRPVKTKRVLIGDSIEGWSDAVKMLMKAYFANKALPVFDFSDIRPKGALLLTSGGKAPGPEPLKDCLHNVQKILDRKQNGEKLIPIEVHDICCYIADAVLSGGIRRCLPKQYAVQLKNGKWKSIANIEIGDEVLYNGAGYPVIGKINNGIQSLLRINTLDGYHISTPNHRWLVFNEETKKIEWVEAQHIIPKKHVFLKSK